MDTSGSTGDTGKPGQLPGGGQKLVGLVLVAVLLVGLAGATGFFIARRPAVQVDANTVALQEGIAAFKAGAFKVALEKFKPLAKQGNAQASYWLGRMNEDGLGMAKDVNAAISLYGTAAEGGWTAAKFQLGEIYFRGMEELQDFKKARKWLEQAARDGSAPARADLGRLYANGWGGPKDLVQAYVWYEFAAKQGDYAAQRLRDGLLKNMPDEDVAKAQDLTEKMAPEVFAHANDKANGTKTQENASAK